MASSSLFDTIPAAVLSRCSRVCIISAAAGCAASSARHHSLHSRVDSWRILPERPRAHVISEPPVASGFHLIAAKNSTRIVWSLSVQITCSELWKDVYLEISFRLFTSDMKEKLVSWRRPLGASRARIQNYWFLHHWNGDSDFHHVDVVSLCRTNDAQFWLVGWLAATFKRIHLSLQQNCNPHIVWVVRW